MNPFAHTIAALDEWHKTEGKRAALWSRVDSPETLASTERVVQEALEKVQEAFYHDTKHVNSQGHCRAITITDAKQVSGWRAPQ